MTMAAALPPPLPPPRDDVRHGVRALLTAAQGFERLPPDTRREVARSLVRISSAALDLAEEAGAAPPSPRPRRVRAPVAMAQAGSFSPDAVRQIAPETERILNAVSFPRFVGELITGVFKALNESNQQQIESYVDLIRNVAATTDGFADANVGVAGARSWLMERFPGTFRIEGDSEPGFDDPATMTPDERAEYQAEQAENQRLELAPGAEMPTEGALRTALGVPAGASLPSGDPESLVGPVRALLARNRQSMLASMVMMGMQRIVIDSGRLNASMRFHIDATSAAAEDRGSRFDFRNEIQAGVKAQFGPWGASAKMKNTIGYVSTERTQTEQELNAELDLDSSVELIFRTDYVPLERLAGTGDVNRIRVNALNPTEEARIAQDRRAAREQRRTATRNTRTEQLNRSLQPTALPADDEALEVPEPTGNEEEQATDSGSTETAAEGDTGGGETGGTTTEGSESAEPAAEAGATSEESGSTT